LNQRYILAFGFVIGTFVSVPMTLTHSANHAGDSSRALPSSSQATFNPDGNVRLPGDFRRWESVGTRYKASGRNILDGKEIVVPELMNAYVEPAAFDRYKMTGRWPEGIQIVKELSEIRVGEGCSGVSRLCTSPLGEGIFQLNYFGVGMMVKDRRRFPSAPGNWGYFGFLRDGAGYAPVASLRPQEQCSSSHIKLASDTDFVISKAHLGLSRENIQ
jgi:cytochrome P460